MDPGGFSFTLQQDFTGFAEAGEPSSASDDDDKENEGGNERPAQRCVTPPQSSRCLPGLCQLQPLGRGTQASTSLHPTAVWKPACSQLNLIQIDISSKQLFWQHHAPRILLR